MMMVVVCFLCFFVIFYYQEASPCQCNVVVSLLLIRYATSMVVRIHAAFAAFGSQTKKYQIIISAAACHQHV
jgi:hypothetical protein